MDLRRNATQREPDPTELEITRRFRARGKHGKYWMSDEAETQETGRVTVALRHEPVTLILSRQATPTLDRTNLAPASEVSKGAYVLPSHIRARVSIEQASTFGWERYVGNEGAASE